MVSASTSNASPALAQNTRFAGIDHLRVYITCAIPDDQVLAVTGSGGNSTFIGVRNNFYQVRQRAPCSSSDIDSTAFADNPEVALDSWLTIGLDQPTPDTEKAPSTLLRVCGPPSSNLENPCSSAVSPEMDGAPKTATYALAGDDLRCAGWTVHLQHPH